MRLPSRAVIRVLSPSDLHSGPTWCTSPAIFGDMARVACHNWRDLSAVAIICALVAGLEWRLLKDGIVIGMDTATGFYPWYSYLGEQLRAGHLPLWNPYQFAGTPFAADPESGW